MHVHPYAIGADVWRCPMPTTRTRLASWPSSSQRSRAASPSTLTGRSCELSVVSLLFIAAHIKPHFFLPISASGIEQQWKWQEISRTWTFLTGDNYSLIEFNICKTLVSSKLLKASHSFINIIKTHTSTVTCCMYELEIKVE